MLALPEGHGHRRALEHDGIACLERPARALRVGIINLMPAAEVYELMLLRALGTAAGARGVVVEPAFIRLEGHGYGSSDPTHIARHYRSYADVTRRAPLDGLLLTGAPVEEYPFEQVHYWAELSALLRHARAAVASTVGLCWGGLALARLLGIYKERYPTKLFGLFPLRALRDDVLTAGRALHCPQSRHAGIADRVLEDAETCGVVELLAHGERGGYSLFRSADRRFVAHLGHPEYRYERLVFEYRRDVRAGRADVLPPEHLDLDAPEAAPRSHGVDFFAGWLGELAVASHLEQVAREAAR